VAASLDRAVGVAGADAFRKAVAPVYLRRNQDDVLTELPERIEQEDWVELSADDLEVYGDAVESGNFMAMRRAAYVVDDVERSAKLGRLAQILADAADEGRKVIVFSFFLDVLEVVHRLAAPHAFGPLTGSVPPVERQALVDRFGAADGYAVLVSQIQAGGVGLNIQAASVVVLTEPQWKPSTEEQAIARCHRMGQTRRVQVHRLLAEDCVDSLVLEVVRRKRALFDDYARESDLKDTSPDAVDISESEAARRIVAVEQQRLSRGRPVDGLG
jgi:SNF2 family DNA or RNA helicase